MCLVIYMSAGKLILADVLYPGQVHSTGNSAVVGELKQTVENEEGVKTDLLSLNKHFEVEGVPREWRGGALVVRLIREEIIQEDEENLRIKEVYGVAGSKYVKLINKDL